MKILRKALAASTPKYRTLRVPTRGWVWRWKPRSPSEHASLQKVLTGALRRVKILFPPSGVNVVIIYQLTVQCGEP